MVFHTHSFSLLFHGGDAIDCEKNEEKLFEVGESQGVSKLAALRTAILVGARA